MSLAKILLIVCLLSIGCNSKQEKAENDSKLSTKVDSLINENRKLNEQLSKTPQQITPNDSIAQPDQEKSSIETNKEKYGFVLLKVVVNNGYERIGDNMLPKLELRNVCSQIKTFSLFNEDVKYQFMDEFQSHYMTGSMGTTLKTRECFAFNSYEEASKEREKYLIQ